MHTARLGVREHRGAIQAAIKRNMERAEAAKAANAEKIKAEALARIAAAQKAREEISAKIADAKKAIEQAQSLLKNAKLYTAAIEDKNKELSPYMAAIRHIDALFAHAHNEEKRIRAEIFHIDAELAKLDTKKDGHSITAFQAEKEILLRNLDKIAEAFIELTAQKNAAIEEEYISALTQIINKLESERPRVVSSAVSAIQEALHKQEEAQIKIITYIQNALPIFSSHELTALREYRIDSELLLKVNEFKNLIAALYRVIGAITSQWPEETTPQGGPDILSKWCYYFGLQNQREIVNTLHDFMFSSSSINFETSETRAIVQFTFGLNLLVDMENKYKKAGFITLAGLADKAVEPGAASSLAAPAAGAGVAAIAGASATVTPSIPVIRSDEADAVLIKAQKVLAATEELYLLISSTSTPAAGAGRIASAAAGDPGLLTLSLLPSTAGAGGPVSTAAAEDPGLPPLTLPPSTAGAGSVSAAAAGDPDLLLLSLPPSAAGAGSVSAAAAEDPGLLFRSLPPSTAGVGGPVSTAAGDPGLLARSFSAPAITDATTQPAAASTLAAPSPAHAGGATISATSAAPTPANGAGKKPQLSLAFSVRGRGRGGHSYFLSSRGRGITPSSGGGAGGKL